MQAMVKAVALSILIVFHVLVMKNVWLIVHMTLILVKTHMLKMLVLYVLMELVSTAILQRVHNERRRKKEPALPLYLIVVLVMIM